MVVPVKPTAKSSIPATSDKLMCDYKLGKDSGLLRNEFSQAYLSILGDTRQEGLPIILGCQMEKQLWTEMAIRWQPTDERSREMFDGMD